jgi:ABC-type branched-subunit amino acid transport system substrate-binding protein
VRGAILLALLCLLAVPAPGIAEEPLRLGMSAAFTGPSRGLGIELYRGSKAYFDYINAQGGIHGRPVEIVVRDDGYNPTPAIENTIAFLQEEDDVLLLFNYVGTPTVTRVLPIIKLYQNHHALLFFPFTGAQPQREFPYEDFVFNLRASYRQETAGLVDNFVSLGRTRVAVFYQADAYGRSGWDGVRRALKKYGLSIVGEATYRRGDSFAKSMQQQAEIIRKADPDAIISVGAYAACAAFIRDARDIGLDVPIANLSFVGSENMLDLLLQAGRKGGKDYTENLINSQVVPSYEDLSLPAVVEYRSLMDRFKPQPPPKFDDGTYSSFTYSFVSLEGFFNAKVMAHILEKLGPRPSRIKLRDAAESVNRLDIGIDMPVRFGPERHQGLDVVYYTKVQDDAFVPIEDWSAWSK